MELVLDVNTLLYPIDVGDRFTLVLARTLHEDGAQSGRYYDQSHGPSLADKYEYVMHGHVFKCEEIKDTSSRLYVDDGLSYVSFLFVVQIFIQK